MSATKTDQEPSGNLDKHKRKRSSVPSDEEIEIDLNLPEPLSKKAKRAEKKKSKTKTSNSSFAETVSQVQQHAVLDDAQPPIPAGISPSQKRSEFGIWIGNLPWSATKDILKAWLIEQGDIDDEDILRLHMPVPQAPREQRPAHQKPQNKGFAYVDFSRRQVLDKALALSERLLTGRRVLIKDAKSFEGRPDKPSEAVKSGDGANTSKKEPTNRVFVGNLSFDVTHDDLLQHFGQAGEVEDVHMATFEDSGKCKGFAWVRYVEVESAEAAVKGFMYKNDDSSGDEEEEGDHDEDEKKVKIKTENRTNPRKKRQKWFINRLQGRPLRCEFAEDAQTRYKKRFGKEPSSKSPGTESKGPEVEAERNAVSTDPEAVRSVKREKSRRLGKNQRQDERRKNHERKRDARTVAPGRALANAPRNTGAIVTGIGKKLTFE